MDWLLPLFGGGGALAVVASIVIAVLRTNSADRRDYRAGVASANTEAGKWRVRYDQLQDQLDEERKKRRTSEDAYEKKIDKLREAIFQATGRYPQ